jgi:hypothetical protein
MNHPNTTDNVPQTNTETNDHAANGHAANGRLGAGAKTPEGLARSAKNATRHGLTARTFCLMHNEDPDIFAQHNDSLMATLLPRNPLELLQVQRIIECSWLIQRATQLETLAWQRELEYQRIERREQFANTKNIAFREGHLTYFAFESLESTDKNFQSLARYRTTHERSLQRALNTLTKMRGGATNLSTNIWPDSALPTPSIPESNFCDPRNEHEEPPPETPILQNEAPTELASEAPKVEFCETKPPAAANSLEPTTQRAQNIPQPLPPQTRGSSQ